jgi:hypothetical protein
MKMLHGPDTNSHNRPTPHDALVNGQCLEMKTVKKPPLLVLEVYVFVRDNICEISGTLRTKTLLDERMFFELDGYTVEIDGVEGEADPFVVAEEDLLIAVACNRAIAAANETRIRYEGNRDYAGHDIMQTLTAKRVYWMDYIGVFTGSEVAIALKDWVIE